MGVNPAGTKWSVAEMDNNGTIGNFAATPWEFHDASMNAGTLWSGGYKAIPGCDISYACEIASDTDKFEVHFVTSSRFIATKGGNLYRFGMKI